MRLDTKHTPGPWTYGYTGANGYCVYGGGQHIASSILYKRDGGEANARLIAAAPDLLSALQSLLEMGQVYPTAIEADSPRVDFEVWEKAARAAVAKATG